MVDARFCMGCGTASGTAPNERSPVATETIFATGRMNDPALIWTRRGDVTITDRHIKFKPDFSSKTRYIGLRDVKSISPTLSITILSAFIPIPDCIVIEMKDGAYHHFSVGRFGMLFGQRKGWLKFMTEALAQSRGISAIHPSLQERRTPVPLIAALPSNQPPLLPRQTYAPAANPDTPPTAPEASSAKRWILIGLGGMAALVVVTTSMSLFVGHAKEPNAANVRTVASTTQTTTAPMQAALPASEKDAMSAPMSGGSQALRQCAHEQFEDACLKIPALQELRRLREVDKVCFPRVTQAVCS